MSNLIKKGKKCLTFTVAILTIIWSVGLLGMPISVGAAVSGDLIKITCTGSNASVCTAVYYLGADGKRYVFPNEKTFFTWYTGFSTVNSISQTEMESYPIGGNATYKPGVKMVKITTDPKVYAVAANGTLRWVSSEAVATSLYGANWNQQIDDVSDAFFVNYTVGSSITDAGQYDKAAATAAATSINTDKGLTAGTGTTLSVALAADTPASGIVLSNQVRAPFTTFTLTASTDGDVVVDSVTIQRTGLAQDAEFSSVDLIDDATNSAVNETGKTFNSEHKATFTEDLTVPAGTTKTYTLAGNMGALASYAGETPVLSVTAIALKGGATLVGTLPVSGNYQNINGTITIGSATISRGAYTNATSSTLEVGKTNYTFFSFKIVAGSVEDVAFDQVKVYQQGTASLSSDLENLKLYGQKTNSGTQEMLATGAVSGNYATFTLAAPIVVKKGQTHQYEVRADVKNGSGRTIDLGIYRTTHLLVKGQTYNAYITPTYSSTGSSASNPVLSDNEFTISNGTLQVSKTNDVVAGNIAVAAGQMIGSFKFTVKGEPIDITALTLTVTSVAAATIEDATKGWVIIDPAGNIVAGPTDVTSNALTVAFTDTFTVPIGDTVYKVRADIDLSGGFVSNNTIYVSFTPSAMTARGTVTGNTISATPASAINSNTQTIKAAKVTVSRDSLPANGNIIVGASQTLLGSWTFDASDSGEDIRITSLALAASSVNANNLTLYDGTTALSPVNDAPTVPTPGTARGATNGCATSTFTLTDPLIIAKGAKKTIQLKADVSSAAVAGQAVQYGITSSSGVTAYGKTTGNTATATINADDGATITYSATGALTVSSYNTPNKALVVAASTGNTIQNIKLSSLYETLDVEELYVFVDDGAETGTAVGNYKDVSMVSLWDGTTKLGESVVPSTGNYKFTFSKGTIVVPKDGNKIITIKVDYATISSVGNDHPGTPNADITVGIGGADGIKAVGQDSNTAASETVNASTSTAKVLHASVPIVTLPTASARLGAASSLTNTDLILYAFKVTADSSAAVNRPVLISNLLFDFTTTDGVIISNLYLKDSGGNTISGAVDALPTWTGSTKAYSAFDFNSPLISSEQSRYEYIQIARGETETFYLYGTVSSASTADSISTSLISDNASAMTGSLNGNYVNAFAPYGSNGNFVWSDDWKNVGGQVNATSQSMWYNSYLVSGMGNVVSTTPYTISF